MKLPRLLPLASGLLFAASAHAGITTYTIGDFEGSLDGWSVPTGFGSPAAGISFSNIGATSGTGSLKLSGNIPGGFQWGLVRDMTSYAAALGTAQSVVLSFDVSWDQTEWTTTGGDWAQVYAVVFNSTTTGFNQLNRETIASDTGNPGYPGGWDSTNYAGLHTRTITWDITSLTAGASVASSWNEMAIAINYSGDFTAGGAFYFDNLQLAVNDGAAPIPEPSTYAALAGLVALAFVTLGRRSRR